MKTPYENPPESGWGSGKRVLTPREFHARHTIEENGCWHWKRPLKPSGYGDIIHSDPIGTPMRHTYPHRVAYMLFNGPIPEGFTVDHMCCNRRCVNPAHLQLLTAAENAAKKAKPGPVFEVTVGDLCLRGHRVSAERVYLDRHGRQRCVMCREQYERIVANRKAKAVVL